MTLNVKLLIAGAALPGVLAACSSGGLRTILDTDKVEYKAAGRLPQLEIPPDLARPTGGDVYTVPDASPRAQASTATYSTYSKERAATEGAPVAGTAVLQKQDSVNIVREGDQRWLVAHSDVNNVWEVTRDFWLANGFTIDSENPEAGVMETAWVEKVTKVPDDNGIRNFLANALRSTKIGVSGGPKATKERVKFRTRLERGKDPGTTEIYISERSLEEVPVAPNTASEDTIWKSKPPDPDVEADMLARLMASLGAKDAATKVAAASLPAVPAPLVVERAKLVKSENGIGKLSVADQFDRAWRRVGLALDRVGFTVEDRDRSQGLYFVRYVDPDAKDKAEESKGFFARLNPFSSSSSDKKAASDQFRIQVKGDDNASEIGVLSKDGTQEKSATADRILSLLYEQLR